MHIKHTVKENKIPEMKRQLDQINGEAIEVGVIRGEHAWLAPIHEFGLDIQVTPKMRAYLHKHGLHLKASTTHIKIPERSFLRGGYDENRDIVLKHARMLMADVASGDISADTMYEAVGKDLVERIKDYAEDLKSPPNHPFTVDQKGSSNPLADTGEMISYGLHWRKAK